MLTFGSNIELDIWPLTRAIGTFTHALTELPSWHVPQSPPNLNNPLHCSQSTEECWLSRLHVESPVKAEQRIKGAFPRSLCTQDTRIFSGLYLRPFKKVESDFGTAEVALSRNSI